MPFSDEMRDKILRQCNADGDILPEPEPTDPVQTLRKATFANRDRQKESEAGTCVLLNTYWFPEFLKRLKEAADDGYVGIQINTDELSKEKADFLRRQGFDLLPVVTQMHPFVPQQVTSLVVSWRPKPEADAPVSDDIVDFKSEVRP